MWLRKGAILILMKPQPNRTHSMVLLPMKLTVALFLRQFLMKLLVASLLICKAHIDAHVSGKNYCNQSRGPITATTSLSNSIKGSWLLCSTQRDPKY